MFGTIGGDVPARSPALLRPGGTPVPVAAPPPTTRDDIKTVAFPQESDRHQLIELARLVDQGHLRPQAGAVYSLAEAAKAYRAKATGGIPGRIVLQPRPRACPPGLADVRDRHSSAASGRLRPRAYACSAMGKGAIMPAASLPRSRRR